MPRKPGAPMLRVRDTATPRTWHARIPRTSARTRPAGRAQGHALALSSHAPCPRHGTVATALSRRRRVAHASTSTAFHQALCVQSHRVHTDPPWPLPWMHLASLRMQNTLTHTRSTPPGAAFVCSPRRRAVLHRRRAASPYHEPAGHKPSRSRATRTPAARTHVSPTSCPVLAGAGTRHYPVAIGPHRRHPRHLAHVAPSSPAKSAEPKAVQPGLTFAPAHRRGSSSPVTRDLAHVLSLFPSPPRPCPAMVSDQTTSPPSMTPPCPGHPCLAVVAAAEEPSPRRP
ncbi:hypothetical protein PVAP13_2KG216573 [Panicum virgatum]|uniref:Uncharacterized protein n=1 Tax=Panicum virgatum TaxID=38727 RepID=A0A8T0WDM2_PANVG|nr:hypothetical protein PVAP13_2KG216573 [Panicum virgatum]